jgi:sirohydrochlorin cobaltochelatase
MQGILLFAHGARDPAWARPFEAIAAQMRAAAPDTQVVLGFLELMQPDFGAASAALIDAGCTQLQVVPLFLGAGGHVRRDLPMLIEQARTLHPTVAITTTPAIGETAVVTRAIALAALELATGNSNRIDDGSTPGGGA